MSHLNQRRKDRERSPFASVSPAEMSATILDPVDHEVTAEGDPSPPAAAAAPAKPTKTGQPFKLPYSNGFDVDFKDAASIKDDRRYSEPVTFGPLKWCVGERDSCAIHEIAGAACRVRQRTSSSRLPPFSPCFIDASTLLHLHLLIEALLR